MSDRLQSRTPIARLGGSTLGQKGLPVNDPTRTFPLRSLAGEYSALHLCRCSGPF